MSEYQPTVETARIVRQTLRKHYGAKFVTVTKGRGTASGWVEARVIVPKSAHCTCPSLGQRCADCRDVLNAQRERAEKLVRDAGAIFSHYYSDDYSDPTPRDCFLLSFDTD